MGDRIALAIFCVERRTVADHHQLQTRNDEQDLVASSRSPDGISRDVRISEIGVRPPADPTCPGCSCFSRTEPYLHLGHNALTCPTDTTPSLSLHYGS